jgi:hypothetical protein
MLDMSKYPVVHITNPIKAWDPREVIVHIVDKKPDIPFLSPAYGITTEESARSFGENTGCPDVYWVRHSQRAYGVKAKKAVTA